MKGVELPVNVLVIVALAVIVLLGVVALFTGVFGPSGATITTTQAWQQACTQVTLGCSNNHANDIISTVTFGDRNINNFGNLCGVLGRYDGSLVTFTVENIGTVNSPWALAPGSSLTLATDAANTAKNGCNIACGC